MSTPIHDPRSHQADLKNKIISSPSLFTVLPDHPFTPVSFPLCSSCLGRCWVLSLLFSVPAPYKPQTLSPTLIHAHTTWWFLLRHQASTSMSALQRGFLWLTSLREGPGSVPLLFLLACSYHHYVTILTVDLGCMAISAIQLSAVRGETMAAWLAPVYLGSRTVCGPQ